MASKQKVFMSTQIKIEETSSEEEKTTDESTTEESSEEPEEMWEVNFIHAHRITASNEIFFKTYWKSTKTTAKNYSINDYWSQMKSEILQIKKKKETVKIFWRPSWLEPSNFVAAKETLRKYCANNEIDLNTYSNGKI